MPKMVSQIAPGTQFARTWEPLRVADEMTIQFRVVKNSPTEFINIPQACGINIGDPHPDNPNIWCKGFTGAYEGDSRMVLICSFVFGTTPANNEDAEDPGQYTPDIRPPNFSVSTSLMEVPVYTWTPIAPAPDAGKAVCPANAVGDRYDGVTKLEPVVTITVTQFENGDPLAKVLHVGKVNQEQFKVGSLLCFPRSVMFRGIQCTPSVEAFGSQLYRGFNVSYEFAFRANNVAGIGTNQAVQQVGWDIVVPHTGMNVKAFDPADAENRDPYGQPLNHENFKIKTPLELFTGVAPGDKVPAMVKVFSYEGGGASQVRASMPIPLNTDGKPRSVDADPKVLVYRYRVHEEINFKNTFGLRLQ